VKKYARKEKDDEQKEYVDSSENALRDIKKRKRILSASKRARTRARVCVRVCVCERREIDKERVRFYDNFQHVKEKAAHFEYEKILQNSPKHIRKQHGWILFPTPFEQQTTATAGFFFFLLVERALFFRFAFCR